MFHNIGSTYTYSRDRRSTICDYLGFHNMFITYSVVSTRVVVMLAGQVSRVHDLILQADFENLNLTLKS